MKKLLEIHKIPRMNRKGMEMETLLKLLLAVALLLVVLGIYFLLNGDLSSLLGKLGE